MSWFFFKKTINSIFLIQFYYHQQISIPFSPPSQFKEWEPRCKEIKTDVNDSLTDDICTIRPQFIAKQLSETFHLLFFPPLWSWYASNELIIKELKCQQFSFPFIIRKTPMKKTNGTFFIISSIQCNKLSWSVIMDSIS